MPHVTLFGHGSSNHMTYHLWITGKPTLALEQDSASVLLGLTKHMRTHVDIGKGAKMRIHNYLYIHAPFQFRERLASLAETIPRLDGINIDGERIVIDRDGE